MAAKKKAKKAARPTAGRVKTKAPANATTERARPPAQAKSIKPGKFAKTAKATARAATKPSAMKTSAATLASASNVITVAQAERPVTVNVVSPMPTKVVSVAALPRASVSKPAPETRLVLKKAEIKPPQEIRPAAPVTAPQPPQAKRRDVAPTEGYALAIDGRVKSHYASSADAHAAGLALKQKFPVLDVIVLDIAKSVRIRVEPTTR